MKRQKKQLLILIVLLLVILAAYIGMRVYNGSHSGEEESTPSYPVTQADTAAVTGFTLQNENGSYTFEKREDKWHCLEDGDLDIDTASMEDMIGAVVSVTGEDRIEGVSDMAQYGLEEPAIRVTFTTEAGSTALNIGDYNSAISKYYICLEGQDTVYTVDSAVRSRFTKELEDLKTVETQED